MNLPSPAERALYTSVACGDTEGERGAGERGGMDSMGMAASSGTSPVPRARGWIPLILLILLLLAPLTLAREPAPSPFDGFTQKEITAHRKKAEGKVKLIIRRWVDARDELVIKCPRCKGVGQIRQLLPGGRARAVGCPQCTGTGGYVSKKDFLRVFWEYFSSRYRTPERQRLLEGKYAAARANPGDAVSDLLQIDRCKRKVVEVHGNFATVRLTVKRAGVWQEETHEFIEDDNPPGTWCIYHEEADVEFVRFRYPAASPEGEAPAPVPTDDSSAAGTSLKPVPSKPPEPSGTRPPKPVEDPAKLFSVSQVTFRHVEENAYKVFGSVKNLTSNRRFAYIVIEVALYQGDRLVDTASCNVGTAILGPGKDATFSGFIYCDEAPDYDRLVPQIVKFEELQ
jgi:hypothetical protein